ncbi:MAG: hypothetical protein M3Q73_03255 [bacterium]|nr:hypothetical protein [bacterium]
MNTIENPITHMLFDMRSPLAAILLNLEMLEKQKVGHLTKIQQQLISAMRESALKLQNTIDQSVVASNSLTQV